MSSFTERLQSACRGALRPLLAMARKALTPAAKPATFTWQSITAGPAAGTTALLPEGMPIAKAITGGHYESDVLAIVQALVADSDVCYDIGGHYGYYTLCLAKLAPQGQIHTFEPVDAHARRITQSAQRSGLNNVTVHQAAVAGQDGEMTLQVAEAAGTDDSMAYLDSYGGVDTEAAREHYPRFTRTTVQARTLDTLGTELPRPGFIKIDAEGAEGPILQSGLQLIADAKPRLLIELHGIVEGLCCAELLQSVDYQAILLTDQKITMPILWTPRNDSQALRAVKAVLGRDPIVLFDQGDSDS